MFENLMNLGLPPQQVQQQKGQVLGQVQPEKKTARQILQENGHTEESFTRELQQYGFAQDQISIIKDVVLNGIPAQQAVLKAGMNMFRAQQTWQMVTQVAAKLGYKL